MRVNKNNILKMSLIKGEVTFEDEVNFDELEEELVEVDCLCEPDWNINFQTHQLSFFARNYEIYKNIRKILEKLHVKCTIELEFYGHCLEKV